MDNNNIIDIEKIDPAVRYANYHSGAQGIGWLNRSITDPQLLLCIKGELEFFYQGGEKQIFKERSLLFIEAGKQHSLSVVKDCMISTFHFEFIQKGAWATNEYRVNPMPETLSYLGEEFEKFHQFFKLLEVTFNDYKKYRRERVNCLSRYILLEAFHYWNKPSSSHSNKRMEDIIAYIRAHITEDVDRNLLGKLFYITPEHINLLFKKELNCTPTDFINRERCIIASRLLNEGDTVKEASFKTGFHDPAYFCRVFKKYMMIKPIQMKR